MAWVRLSDQQPIHNQWVVVPVGDGFKAGQFDKKHPFAPAIVDRATGKFFYGFDFWQPLFWPREQH